MNIPIILTFLVGAVFCNDELVPSHVLSILKDPWKARSLIIWNTTNLHLEWYRSVTKHIAINGLPVQVLNIPTVSVKDIDAAGLAYCKSDIEVEDIAKMINENNLALQRPFLILIQIEEGIEAILNDLSYTIRIDQQVYIVSSNNFTVTEAYSVNGFPVIRELGQYIANVTEGLHFRFRDNVLSAFEERRGDFHGYHFIGMSQRDPPYNDMDKDYKEKSKYFESNQTYDVTSLTKGMYRTYWRTMAKNLNFTYTLFARKDGRWGTLKDGEPQGMMQNLHEGSAEVIAADFTISRMRWNYVHFLPVLTTDKRAIVIRAKSSEDISWRTYIKPFSLDLWLVMVVFAVGIAVILHVVSTDISKPPQRWPWRIFPLFGWLWVAWSAYAGGKPKDSVDKNGWSSKLILFSYLLGGNVIWIGYRASFTSELSTVMVTYPIDSMESLLSSEYKLYTAPHGAALANVFTHARKGSIYEKLMQNNMDDSSFVGYKIKPELISSPEKIAYLGYKKSLLAQTDLTCKVAMVWESWRPTEFMTIAMRKNSTFIPFLTRAVHKLREDGTIHIIEARTFSYEASSHCDSMQSDVKPLGINKLTGLFIILIGGFVLSAATFLLECLDRKNVKEQSEIAKQELKTSALKNTLATFQGLLQDSDYNPEEFQFHLQSLEKLLHLKR